MGLPYNFRYCNQTSGHYDWLTLNPHKAYISHIPVSLYELPSGIFKSPSAA